MVGIVAPSSLTLVFNLRLFAGHPEADKGRRQWRKTMVGIVAPSSLTLVFNLRLFAGHPEADKGQRRR